MVSNHDVIVSVYSSFTVYITHISSGESFDVSVRTAHFESNDNNQK